MRIVSDSVVDTQKNTYLEERHRHVVTRHAVATPSQPCAKERCSLRPNGPRGCHPRPITATQRSRSERTAARELRSPRHTALIVRGPGRERVYRVS